jgi:hypothetical protein
MIMDNLKTSVIVILVVQAQSYHNDKHNVNCGSVVIGDCERWMKGGNCVPYAALEMV